MNLVLWGKGSSAAVPFTTLIALLALWFGVSVPLTFIGAYFGFRKRVSIHQVVKIQFSLPHNHRNGESCDPYLKTNEAPRSQNVINVLKKFQMLIIIVNIYI